MNSMTRPKLHKHDKHAYRPISTIYLFFFSFFSWRIKTLSSKCKARPSMAKHSYCHDKKLTKSTHIKNITMTYYITKVWKGKIMHREQKYKTALFGIFTNMYMHKHSYKKLKLWMQKIRQSQILFTNSITCNSILSSQIIKSKEEREEKNLMDICFHVLEAWKSDLIRMLFY